MEEGGRSLGWGRGSLGRGRERGSLGKGRGIYKCSVKVRGGAEYVSILG